jgi:hypothetical protein
MLLHNVPSGKMHQIILGKKSAYTSHCKELVWFPTDADKMAPSTKDVRPVPVATDIIYC